MIALIYYSIIVLNSVEKINGTGTNYHSVTFSKKQGEKNRPAQLCRDVITFLDFSLLKCKKIMCTYHI